MRCSLKTCLYFTAAGLITYWVAVFSGAFPVEELVPGYRSWFMSFPVADLWIAFMAILAVRVAPSNRALSTIAMAAAGSGLIFLGLNAFAYGISTGLVTKLTIDEIAEIAIKVYCLTAGGWLVASAYRQASEFSEL